MTQVSIAFGADHFGADHAVADIAHFHHGTALDRRVEARPATAGIELGPRIEQRFVATDAVVHTVGLGGVVFTGKRALGALQPADVVLLRVEHGTPFFKGSFQLFHRLASAIEKARSDAFPRVGRHV